MKHDLQARHRHSPSSPTRFALAAVLAAAALSATPAAPPPPSRPGPRAPALPSSPSLCRSDDECSLLGAAAWFRCVEGVCTVSAGSPAVAGSCRGCNAPSWCDGATCRDHLPFASYCRLTEFEGVRVDPCGGRPMGQYCMNGVCLGRSPNGGPCLADDYCAEPDQACVGGHCTPLRPEGWPCAGDHECQKGLACRAEGPGAVRLCTPG
jgi:hypothetical protein